MDGVLAVLGALGTLAITIAGAIGIWWIRILDRRHKQQMERDNAERKAKKDEAALERKAKKETSDELRTVVEQLRLEVKVSRDEIHGYANKLDLAIKKEHLCQVALAAANERIDHLEDRLEEEGIKVKRKTESKSHQILPSDHTPPLLGDE